MEKIKFEPILDLKVPGIERTYFGDYYSPARSKTLILESAYNNTDILVLEKNYKSIEFPTHCALYLAKRLMLSYRDYMEDLKYLKIFASEVNEIVQDYSDYRTRSGIYANKRVHCGPLYRPTDIVNSTDSMRGREIGTYAYRNNSTLEYQLAKCQI